MVASAGVSAIRPWPTNEVTSMAVALLLCTMAVTTMPAMNASQRLDMFWPMTWRRLEP
jgi:Spy/CpxP family protein refolding chaperone